jgi:hypothetical protein
MRLFSVCSTNCKSAQGQGMETYVVLVFPCIDFGQVRYSVISSRLTYLTRTQWPLLSSLATLFKIASRGFKLWSWEIARKQTETYGDPPPAHTKVAARHPSTGQIREVLVRHDAKFYWRQTYSEPGGGSATGRSTSITPWPSIIFWNHSPSYLHKWSFQIWGQVHNYIHTRIDCGGTYQ